MRFVGDWPIRYRYRRPAPCAVHTFIWATDGRGDVCYRCGVRAEPK